ncbi:MAG: VWA domain-containing protein [Candidatus Aenigmatarchaeota archaeon]
MIIILVLIAIFINRVFFFRAFSAEEARSLELKSTAINVLNILTGSEKCLAFKEISKIGASDLNLSLHNIIDSRKLNEFATQFSDVEPKCAKDFKFGYRVRVESLYINITSQNFTTKPYGVFYEILKLIDGKKILFLLDSSGSMSSPAGPMSKIECLKNFTKGFVQYLKPGSGVAAIAYGLSSGDKCRSSFGKSGCCIKKLFDLTILDGGRSSLIPIIDSLHASSNTPIALVLEEGFIYAENNGIDTIILLTDGKETCEDSKEAVNVAKNNANKGIVVHTIGFGTSGIDFDLLREVAKLTGGKFFDARTCEELISPLPKEKLNVEIYPMIWEFGSSVFSKNKAMKEKFTFSLPTNIYFDESTILPAKIEITIVDGEMESFINMIEQACYTKQKIKFPIFLSYPTYVENTGASYLCMDFLSGKECQRIDCDLPLNFPPKISPGNYIITIQPLQDSIEVII